MTPQMTEFEIPECIIQEIQGNQIVRRFTEDQLAETIHIFGPRLMIDKAYLMVSRDNVYSALAITQVNIGHCEGHFPNYPMMRLADLGILMSTVGNIALLLRAQKRLVVEAGVGLHTWSSTPLHVGDILVTHAQELMCNSDLLSTTATVYRNGIKVCSYDLLQYQGVHIEQLKELRIDSYRNCLSTNQQIGKAVDGDIKFNLPVEDFFVDARPTLVVDKIGCDESDPPIGMTITQVPEYFCRGYFTDYYNFHLGYMGLLSSQICQLAIKLADPKQQKRVLLATECGSLRRFHQTPILPGDTLIGVGQIIDDMTACASIYYQGRKITHFDSLHYSAVTLRLLERLRPQS